jgi:hypothetical protein
MTAFGNRKPWYGLVVMPAGYRPIAHWASQTCQSLEGSSEIDQRVHANAISER